MSLDHSDAMLGALLGIVATLLGSWTAFRLTVARDRIARRQEITAALWNLLLDLKAQDSALDPDDKVHTLDATAYALIQAKSVLPELPHELAMQIAMVFHMFKHINESIRFKDLAVMSVVASGSFSNSQPDASGIFNDIRDLKAKARLSVKECTVSIERFIAAALYLPDKGF